MYLCLFSLYFIVFCFIEMCIVYCTLLNGHAKTSEYLNRELQPSGFFSHGGSSVVSGENDGLSA